MKLLIITQKVDQNDSILGFFHEWILEFSKNCDSALVICLEKGAIDLPDNVEIFSLGKELGVSKFSYILNFYRLIWKYRKEYNAVFVHMNPEYTVLGGILWKFLGKKIGLWYTHKSVNIYLKIAVRLSNVIFTASKESFKIDSPKVIVTGHGIDMRLYSPRDHFSDTANDKYTILSVSRLSQAKNILTMVRSFEILKNKNFDAVLFIVGSPVTPEDKKYELDLKEYINSHNLNASVVLVGPVKPHDAVGWYQKSDLFINLSDTGSLDKALLEAMACRLQIVTSNEAFRGIVSEESFTINTPEQVSSHIIKLSASKPSLSLRQYVETHHNLTNLIPKLVSNLKRE